MTNEEVLKHFKSLQKRYTTQHNGVMCEKVKIAIEAIEKQIPAEYLHTNLTVFSCARQSVCPKCLHIIITNPNEYPKYCSECGHKLDWEF